MTPSYQKMSEVYKIFATDWDNLDFTPEALEEMYLYESKGIGDIDVSSQHIDYLTTGKKVNGYSVGKKYLNVTVKSWLKDLEKPGWLSYLQSLYEDEFPSWWLDKIFKKFLEDKEETYKRTILKVSKRECEDEFLPKTVFERERKKWNLAKSLNTGM